DLLAGAGRAQFEPRWNDRKVTSPGQEFAAKLFSNAGLVIPKAETGDSVGVYLARIALTEQLQLDAARSAGVDVTQTGELDAFKASDQGKSIEIALQGIADEDIKFGADRTFDAYRLLTGAPADATVTELSPGEGVAGLA